MENKIPTAKEFLWNGTIITQGDTEPYGRLPNDKVPLVMIEFAKLHVEKILELQHLKYYAGETGYIKKEEWEEILTNIK